jgi:transcriptional regulator with XRE-family HTH domain
VTEDDEIPRARIALGRQLAVTRQTAGLSQQELGSRIAYSRSTVANVETGRQQVAREFRERCETVLDASGVLLAGHDELEAAEQQRRETKAQAAQAERQVQLQAWRESVGAGQPGELDVLHASSSAAAGNALGGWCFSRNLTHGNNDQGRDLQR